MTEDIEFHKQCIEQNLKSINKNTPEIIKDFWVVEAVQYGVSLDICREHLDRKENLNVD